MGDLVWYVFWFMAVAMFVWPLGLLVWTLIWERKSHGNRSDNRDPDSRDNRDRGV